MGLWTIVTNSEGIRVRRNLLLTRSLGSILGGLSRVGTNSSVSFRSTPYKDNSRCVVPLNQQNAEFESHSLRHISLAAVVTIVYKPRSPFSQISLQGYAHFPEQEGC